MFENTESEPYNLDYIEPLHPKWQESYSNVVKSVTEGDHEVIRTLKLAYLYDRKGVPSFDNVASLNRNLSYGSHGDDLVMECTVQIRIPQHSMTEELEDLVTSAKLGPITEEIAKAQEEFDHAKQILEVANKRLKEVRGEV